MTSIASPSLQELTAIAEEATAALPGPFAQQNPAELAQLLALIGHEQPEYLAEIGVYFAGTAWAIHRAFPEVKLICVDNCSLDLDVDTGARLEYLGVPATFIDGDSTSDETLERVKAIANPVDFVFIDASHRYDDVKRDWELYSSITRPGGVVVLADIAVHPVGSTSVGGDGRMDVDILWGEVSPEYEHWVIEAPPLDWGSFGVIRLPA